MKSPDINETHRTEGADAARARHDHARKYKPQEGPKQEEPKKEAGWRDGTFTGADLRNMTFPPVSWVVPDIIPAEGVALLCSKPKFGKSWLAYDLCIACTLDRFTLGEKKPAQGDVLYLALEDSKRRLRWRMKKLLPYEDRGVWPDRLTIKTEWRRLHEGGLDDIREWHRETAEGGGKPILVVIDVLAKLRKPTGNRPAYEGDYEALTGLCRLANELGFAVLVIHHTRKMQSDDLMEMASGTFGVTGAVDTVLVMASKQGGAVLDIRGRDVESAELAIQFKKDSCKWTILGAAAEVHVSEQRSKIITALKDTNAPMTIRELVEATGLKRNPLELLLGRMVKDAAIKRVGTGRYAHNDYTPPPEPDEPTSVRSVRSVAPRERARQTKQRTQAIEIQQASGDVCRSVRSVGKGTSNGKPPAEELKPGAPVKTQTDQTDGHIGPQPIETIKVSSDANLSGTQTDQTDQTDPTDLPPDHFKQQRQAKARAQRERSKARKLGRLSARVSIQEVRHHDANATQGRDQ
jgi:AAA domain-containing protein